MWISAFSCIRPTDKLKREIGEWVLSQLASKEATILSDSDGTLMEDLKQRCLIARFNKS